MPRVTLYLNEENYALYRKIYQECKRKGISLSWLFATWLRRHEEESKEANDGNA